MVKKLKPCPKCMGTLVALQTDKAHEGLWQGSCMKCGKTGPWCKSQLEAIDAWNIDSDNKRRRLNSDSRNKSERSGK